MPNMSWYTKPSVRVLKIDSWYYVQRKILFWWVFYKYKINFSLPGDTEEVTDSEEVSWAFTGRLLFSGNYRYPIKFKRQTLAEVFVKKLFEVPDKKPSNVPAAKVTVVSSFNCEGKRINI